jgi:hypothetical protein
LARTGRAVPAVVVLNGEGMCENCFRGKAILGTVEEGGIYRGRLPGYNSGYSGGMTLPKKRHFVSNLRLRQPKPISECR